LQGAVILLLLLMLLLLAALLGLFVVLLLTSDLRLREYQRVQRFFAARLSSLPRCRLCSWRGEQLDMLLLLPRKLLKEGPLPWTCEPQRTKINAACTGLLP
jgi:hypothetical protein